MVREIYDISRLKSFKQDYALIDQLRRAAVSIASNIAEGFGRGGNKEFLYFLSISSGSLREVQSLLYVALDQNYISNDAFEALYAHAELVSNTIGAFARYLKESGFKGPRFHSK